MAQRKGVFLGLNGKECGVLAAYLAMVCFAILHYQPWEDEGRAWLDARDCNLYQLTFHVLRYEGHPALWYWVLWPLSHLHVPFLAINWIAATCAGSAIYLLLRCAPFPFYLRALLPFSFALGYEYAVVGRGYCMFALLGFTVAWLYRQTPARPIGMAIALSLLANLSVHGMLVACCFAAAFVWKNRKAGTLRWDKQNRRAAGIFAASLVFLAVCVWPTRRLEAPVAPAIRKMLRHVEPVAFVISPPAPAVLPPQMGGVGGMPLRERVRFAVVYPIATWTAVAVLFQAVMFVYVYRRGAALLVLAPLLLYGMLIVLYLKLWHTGLLWVTLVMMLWAVWDETERPSALTLQNAVAAFFALLCVLQLPWTAGAIRYELSHSTYPAKAAAAYVKALPPGVRVDGYGIAYTLLPYFRGPAFANAIVPLAAPDDPAADDPDAILLGQLSLTDEVESKLLAAGYSETRTFCGAQYFPNQTIVPTCLLLFRRTSPR